MKDFYRQKEWEQESYTTQKTELVIASLVFPDGLGIKNLPANAGDVSLIPGWENPLEKEMATHSSALTWEIPWTKEPGEIQSMVSQESWTRLSN